MESVFHRTYSIESQDLTCTIDTDIVADTRSCIERLADFCGDVYHTGQLVQAKGNLYGLFNQVFNSQEPIQKFSSLAITFHLVRNPKIMETFYRHQKSDEEGFFTISKNAYTEVFKDAFPSCNPLKDCILYCDKENSKRLRQAILSTISAKQLREQEFAFEEVLDQLKSKFFGKEINALELTSTFTSAIICKLAINYTATDMEEYYHIYNAVRIANEYPMMVVMKKWISTDDKKNYEDSINILKTIIEKVYEQDKNREGTFTHCHLNQDFTEEEIKCTLLAMLMGGSETSASILAYSLWQLGQKPDLQKQIIHALQHSLSEAEELIDRLFRESMRLCPPAFMTVRTARQDLNVSVEKTDKTFKYTILKGENIAFLHALAGQEETGCDNPHEFDISHDNRFILWKPFGGGKHLCPGQALVKQEFKNLIKFIISECHVSSSPSTLTMKGTALTKTQEEIKCHLTLRE